MEKQDKVKFIKKFILFLLIIVLFIFIINNIYIKLVINDKIILRQDNLFEEYKYDINLIFMGDSHGNCAVNPSYIENSYNFSAIGESYEQTYFKLRKIINEMPELDTVVVPIDLHSFFDYRKNPYVDAWYWKKYLSYEELSILTEKNILNLLININFPFIGNGIDMKRAIISKNNRLSELKFGYSASDYVITKDAIIKEAEDRVDSQFVTNKIDLELFNFFIEVVKLVIEKDKKIILIKYPVTKSYIEAVKQKGINVYDYYAIIEKEISKYENLYILDYQNIFSDLNYFTDSDHLNSAGAESFSKILNNDLINHSGT